MNVFSGCVVFSSCLAAVLPPVAASAETVRISIEPGEYWWGGTVGGGWRMPVGVDGYEM